MLHGLNAGLLVVVVVAIHADFHGVPFPPFARVHVLAVDRLVRHTVYNKKIVTDPNLESDFCGIFIRILLFQKVGFRSRLCFYKCWIWIVVFSNLRLRISFTCYPYYWHSKLQNQKHEMGAWAVQCTVGDRYTLILHIYYLFIDRLFIAFYIILVPT